MIEKILKWAGRRPMWHVTITVWKEKYKKPRFRVSLEPGNHGIFPAQFAQGDTLDEAFDKAEADRGNYWD